MEDEFKPGMMVKTTVRTKEWSTVEVVEARSDNPHKDIFSTESKRDRLSIESLVMFLEYHEFEQHSFSKILHLNKVFWIRTKYLRLLNNNDFKTL